MPVISNRRFDEHTAAKAKPKAKPYELRDGKETGLILRIQPTGTKTWYCVLRTGRRHKIGDATKTNLTEARKAVQLARANNASPVTAKEAKAADADVTSRVPTLFEFLHVPFIEYEAKKGCKRKISYVEWYLMKHPKDQIRAERKKASRFYHINKDLNYVGGLNNFAALKEFDKTRLDQFERKRIEGWVVRRSAEVTPATIRRNIGALQTLLRRAVFWGVIEKNPLAGPAFVDFADSARQDFLSPEQEKRLRKELKHSQPYFQKMVLLALNTGMRRGELLTLRWSDVNFERRQIKIRPENAKSKKMRHIPLNDEALAILRSIDDKDPDRHVILYRDSSVMNTTGAWRKLAERAELGDVRFHDLRHTFASNLVQKGIPIYTVQQLLGHSDPKLTARYSHLAEDYLLDAVKKL